MSYYHTIDDLKRDIIEHFGGDYRESYHRVTKEEFAEEISELTELAYRVLVEVYDFQWADKSPLDADDWDFIASRCSWMPEQDLIFENQYIREKKQQLAELPEQLAEDFVSDRTYREKYLDCNDDAKRLAIIYSFAEDSTHLYLKCDIEEEIMELIEEKLNTK